MRPAILVLIVLVSPASSSAQQGPPDETDPEALAMKTERADRLKSLAAGLIMGGVAGGALGGYMYHLAITGDHCPETHLFCGKTIAYGFGGLALVTAGLLSLGAGVLSAVRGERLEDEVEHQRRLQLGVAPTPGGVSGSLTLRF